MKTFTLRISSPGLLEIRCLLTYCNQEFLTAIHYKQYSALIDDTL